MKRKKYQIYFLFLIVFLVALFIVKQVVHTGLTEEEIIAVVDGEKILYREIMIDPENRDTASDEILSKEKKRLYLKIKEIMQERTINKMGIKVTDQEAKNELDDIYSRSDIDETKASKVRNDLLLIVGALEKWEKTPERSLEIYEEVLSDSSITTDSWEIYRQCYPTKEKIKELREQIPLNVEDMKMKSVEEMKKEIAHRKLKERIAEDVSVNREEIKEYYQKQFGTLHTPTLEEIETWKNEALQYKKDKVMKRWWQEQYEQADIVIKSPQFDDVVDTITLP